MKGFKILSWILTIVAVGLMAFPEVGAMAPQAVSDFLISPNGGVMVGATVSLAGFSRKERQKSNLGGIRKLILFSASDFMPDTEWPKRSEIVAGVTTIVPPLKVGVVGAVLTFDIGTCRVKSDKKGKLGYQNVGVNGECKFAGYDAAQTAALDTTFNEGGVAIAIYKDGTRAVYGSNVEPLEFSDTTDSGAKADDQLMIDFKFMGDGYDFHPPILGPAVTIPLPV